MKLLLATTSQGKILEQREALKECSEIDIVTLDLFPESAPPEEPGPGFIDNASAKALYYHGATGTTALGEDSGLVIDALGGEPGIASARFMGHDTSYVEKNREILRRLEGVPEQDRSARYVSAVALAVDGHIVFSAERTCEGRIGAAPVGEGGFGYDPIFFFPPFERTMAELTRAEKNRVSHRGQSMAVLRAYLAKVSA